MRYYSFRRISRRNVLYFLLVVASLCYASLKFYQAYHRSLFAYHGERIQFIMYGQDTTFYSLDRTGDREYVMHFDPDLKVAVPGGYGDYRVGSLGKLAFLTHDPQLVARTFSVASSSFIHSVFIPQETEVYYGKHTNTQDRKPSISHLLFQHSNAGILDRVYLIALLYQSPQDNFTTLTYRKKRDEHHREDVYFQSESFEKNSIGLLYQSQYRAEQKNIQIRYNSSYSAADTIKTVLSGNGIRVSDIAQHESSTPDRCMIIQHEGVSSTASDLALYYGCDMKIGKTDVYDVIFELGSANEKLWSLSKD